MTAIQFHTRVEFEDGETVEVTADQRDLSAWEKYEGGGPFSAMHLTPVTFMRYVSWSALDRAARREGRKRESFKDWDDRVVEVLDNAEGGGVVSAPDPTAPDRSSAT